MGMGETDPHVMGVLDVMPMTWRRWDLLLVLDGNGELNIDVLHYGTLLNKLMVDLNWDCYIHWGLGDYGYAELLEHFDLDGNFDVLFSLLLDGVFDLSIVHFDSRDLVSHFDLNDDWHLVCDSDLFQRRFGVLFSDHFDLRHLNGNLLNIVFGDFALLLGDDDLHLGRADHGRCAATGGEGTATPGAADACAVLTETSAVSPLGGHHC